MSSLPLRHQPPPEVLRHRTSATARARTTCVSLATCALATCALALGCTAAGTRPSSPAPADARLSPADQRTELTLGQEAVRVIAVRYTTASDGALEEAVTFRIEGTSGGAWLSHERKHPTADGQLEVELHAGGPARFDVVASARGARPLTFSVHVLPYRFGEVEVSVRDAGNTPVEWVELALFAGVRCHELGARVPAPLAVQELPPASWARFESVPIGIPLAAFGVGLDRRDAIVADGCTDLELDGRLASAEVRTRDLHRRPDGTYELSFTIDAFSSDDANLRDLTDLWADVGLDPAGFLVQYVATHPETPPRLADELKVSSSRRLVAEHLEDGLSMTHPQTFLDDVYGFSRAVEDALFEVTLASVLRFRARGEEFGEPGEHAISWVSVPVGGAPLGGSVEGDAAQVYLTPGESYLEIHPHELHLPLGHVVETVIDELVLPATVRDAPAHADVLLEDLYDCDAIAAALEQESSFWRDLTTDVCLAGRRLLRSDAEDHFAALWMHDTLRVWARAELEDSDGDGIMESIGAGEAALRFIDREDGRHLDFAASLDGRRVDGTSGWMDPVHERIRALD